ncbi:flagellar filament capping protein FliD [Thermodesulfatator autotrophicus]|uniref:Flagellar hook-associated protein 2 n=1 Tax=Thermodesulfatator autotrophicus TaxID=1795632 RepID=A0A177E9E7_9BACT|nr:flagellar filament capping protein FliD [Thermodesulfatator autotrophicus]OAG28577.1 hypothetical protein TH606_01065 [Thermodesulfatator autotrophicus]
MGISVGGLVSGLDVDNIVSQLVEVERRPIKLLEAKEQAYQVKLSSYGQLKASIEELANQVDSLKSLELFDTFLASSSNDSIVFAEVNGTPEEAVNELVVNRLATFQRLKSEAFSDLNEEIGTGKLKISIGDEPAVEIEITEENNTLADIARAINEAEAGVKAQVVADGTGNYFLLLSGEKTGAANTIKIEVDEDGDGVFNESPDEQDTTGLSRLAFNPDVQNLTETQAAQDAEIIYNGITVYRPENTVEDLIEGVKLTLRKADPSETVTITTQRDWQKLEDALNGFVEKFNTTMGLLKDLQKFDPANPENNGVLLGDTTISLIKTRLTRLTSILAGEATATIRSLSDMGIVFNRDGFLEVDNERLNNALQNHFEEVKAIFTDSENGLWAQFGQVLKGVEESLKAKEDGLEKSLERISERKTRLEERISRYEERIREQFNNLEVLLAQYQKTSEYLGHQIEVWSSLITGSKK